MRHSYVFRASQYNRRLGLLSLLLAGLFLAAVGQTATIGTARAAQSFADPAFQSVWQRTDQLVANGTTSRSWLWGPEPFTAGLQEDYQEAPGGKRLVQYFDKSRMEINNPAGDKASPYYVSNGLIAVELISGRKQVGNAKFIDRQPADIGVAGDADDTNGPTYRTFKDLTGSTASAVGGPVTQAVDRSGYKRDGTADFGKYGIKQAVFDGTTGHNIAQPFWDYLNTTGPIQGSDGKVSPGRIFEPATYATGLPITDAWWSRVKVGGQVKDVLIQAFERRVLTFTPSNPAAYQVEMGNIGRHYYEWRYNPKYDLAPPAPAPTPTPTPPAKPAVTRCEDLPASTATVIIKCGPAGMQDVVGATFVAGDLVFITAIDPNNNSRKPASYTVKNGDGHLNALIDTDPNGPSGMWTYKLSGQTSGKQYMVYLWLDPAVTKPTILTYPATVKVDQTIVLSILGFKPNEKLKESLRIPLGETYYGRDSFSAGASGSSINALNISEDLPTYDQKVGEYTYKIESVDRPGVFVTVNFTVTQ